MRVSLKVETPGDWLDRLRAAEGSLAEKRVDRVLLDTAEDLKRGVEPLIPLASGIAKGSLRVKKSRKPYTALMAVERKVAPYFRFFEYGTVKMEAVAPFRRGVRAARSRARELLIEGLRGLGRQWFERPNF